MNLSVFLRVGLLLILVFGLLHPSHAGFRPSFSLDYNSWHGTDIVLVEVTARPGVFRVVESWKGDLEAGSPVVIPELQPGTGAVEISAHSKRFEEIGSGVLNEQIPVQPVGSRMALFLKKEPGAPSGQWRPADLVGEMKLLPSG
jgi:hypothetical protein